MVDIQPRRLSTTELKQKLREHMKKRNARPHYWYRDKVALQEKIKARIEAGEPD